MKKLLFFIAFLTSIFLTSCEKQTDEPLVCEIKITNVKMFGGNDGSISVIVTSGNPPYEYELNGISKPNGNFISLKAGDYDILIEDSKNQVFNQSVRLTQPNQLISTYETTNVTTFGGNNGKISVKTKGGTKPYSFKLNNISQNDSIFSNLYAGNYTIIVNDYNNTTITLSNIVISQPAQLTAVATISNVLCFNGNNGKITVNTNGGVSPYQYKLNNNSYQLSNIFENLPIGTNNITVKDNNGTIVNLQNLIITQPTELNSTISKTDVSIYNGNDGNITIITNGGTLPYTYSKDGINFQSSNVFNGLSANSYVIIVKDNNGCIKNYNITITQPAPIITYNVGDIKDGGKVFWVDVSKQHGLIVYDTDYSSSTMGVAYTTTKNLTIGGGGWRLPNKSELSILLTNSTLYGMIGDYWTMTAWGAPADGTDDVNGIYSVHYYGWWDTTVKWGWHNVEPVNKHKFRAVKSF